MTHLGCLNTTSRPVLSAVLHLDLFINVVTYLCHNRAPPIIYLIPHPLAIVEVQACIVQTLTCTHTSTYTTKDHVHLSLLSVAPPSQLPPKPWLGLGTAWWPGAAADCWHGREEINLHLHLATTLARGVCYYAGEPFS